MELVKLSLENQASFHFRDASGNLKTHFSSDQLVSALVNNVALVYGNKETEQFIEKIKAGEIKFSSLYYGLDFVSKKDNKERLTILFLPRPKIDFISKTEPANMKKMKKIAYVSKKLYQYLSNSCASVDDIQEMDVEIPLIVIGNRFAMLQEELKDLDITEQELQDTSFLRITTNPRVEVGRFVQQSENYFTQEDLRVHFVQTKHYLILPYMYFYYEGDLPTYVRTAIRLLCDEGIGGKRSLGRGFFKQVDWLDDEPCELLSTGAFYMNLSTYFPQKDELAYLHSYELEKRNGYVYSMGGKTVRKRSVMVIQEGSLLKGKVAGELLDIRPKGFKHPVYLHGKPILIGFGGGEPA